MKKLLFTLLFLLTGVPAAFAQTDEAKAFAQKTADDIMARVVELKAPLPDKEKNFHAIFTQALDLKKIARFTLGRFAKTASESEMRAFTEAFADNVVGTWTRRFDAYAGEKIVFKDARQENGKDVYVNSELLMTDGQNKIDIVWRVSVKNGKTALVDLIVEGVSMILSYRNEYTAILQQNGGNISDLTEKLKNKTVKDPNLPK